MTLYQTPITPCAQVPDNVANSLIHQLRQQHALQLCN